MNRIKVNINDLSSFFLMLYIFSGYVANDILISSSINAICLYLFLGIGLLSVLIKGINGHLHINEQSKWYFCFVILSFISMMYSPSFSVTSGSFYRLIVCFMVTYFIGLSLSGKNHIVKVSWCYTISAIMLFAILFQSGNLVGTYSNRLGQSLMGNANIFAGMMMYASLFSIWLFVYGKLGLIRRVIVGSGILMEILALALSAGRKYFLVPFIFLYLLLLYKEDVNRRKHIIKYTLICVVLFVAVYYLMMNVPYFYNAIGYRMKIWLDGLFSGKAAAGSIETRQKMKVLAINEWIKSPIFGYGLDSFKYANLLNLGFFYYSHCNYTELLYNSGIIGLIGYYYFIVNKMYLTFKNNLLKVPYKAFAVSVLICQLIFDYGAVTYNELDTQVVLALVFILLSSNECYEEISREQVSIREGTT